MVVTDGFTGNVVLKTLEGSMKFAFKAVLGALPGAGADPAAAALLDALMPLATELDPDTYGGAMLLGVDGVCIISHGSSSARAVVNAVRVAHHAVGGRPRRAAASGDRRTRGRPAGAVTDGPAGAVTERPAGLSRGRGATGGATRRRSAGPG